MIAVHISNRHLDLTPVVGGIADSLQTPVILIESDEDGYVGEASSDWLLMTNNHGFLNQAVIHETAQEVQGTYTPVRLWTDQYSNLFQIMNSIPPWLSSLIQRWSDLFGEG